MALSPRIKAVIRLIYEERVADIGTDHAFLAIELAKAGKKVIATDISADCIRKAEKNISRAGVSGIETRIGDGFSPLFSGEADIAVVAGMGAREIIKILSGKNVCSRFIFVPHQDAMLLRKYLNGNGYFVESDKTVFSEGKFYSVIRAERKNLAECGKGNYSEQELYLGKDEIANEAFKAWCTARHSRLTSIYKRQTEKTVLKEILMLEKALGRLTVDTVEAVIEEIAPKAAAIAEDNVGLLIGDPNDEVTAILVSLDITPEVVEEAKARRANLIVSHHPVMFHPIKNLAAETPEKKAVLAAVKNGISVISAHTNFDFANGGLNDYLMLRLNIVGARAVKDATHLRIGKLAEPMAASKLAEFISQRLNDKVRLIGEDRQIKTAAVMCGGAGRDYELIDRAFSEGADCYISGDTSYDAARYVADQKKTMLVFGHYESEILFIEHMQQLLSERVTGVNIYRAEKNRNPYLI